MAKTIEFYDKKNVCNGIIKLQDRVDLSKLQDEIWRLLDKRGYLEYEQEERI